MWPINKMAHGCEHAGLLTDSPPNFVFFFFHFLICLQAPAPRARRTRALTRECACSSGRASPATVAWRRTLGRCATTVSWTIVGPRCKYDLVPLNADVLSRLAWVSFEYQSTFDWPDCFATHPQSPCGGAVSTIFLCQVQSGVCRAGVSNSLHSDIYLKKIIVIKNKV